MKTTIMRAATAIGLLLLNVATAPAADPSAKCESNKLRIAGKYASCLMRAEADSITRGTMVDYEKCDAKFADKWFQLEQKAGPGVCPSEGDAALMEMRLKADAAEIAGVAGGLKIEFCGDGIANGTEQCDGGDLRGVTCPSLGYLKGDLKCTSSCTLDYSVCVPCQAFSATGQTISYGAGSDGDVEAGTRMRFRDNGDGTVTDLNTGLVWGKKNNPQKPSIHRYNLLFSWSQAKNVSGTMDGTLKTSFLDTLNDVRGGGRNCFAGHCDWRIPNAKELMSILDFAGQSPMADSAFHQPAWCSLQSGAATCSDLTQASCSCTSASNSAFAYWTSTDADPSSASAAFVVDFKTGELRAAGKNEFNYARAVRGGL